MTTTGQPVPVRVYETDRRVMVAMPLPDLEPGDIELTVESEWLTVHGRERGPHRLSPVAATRGEHIGHIGRDAVATSTWAHWLDKHRTGRMPAGDLRDTTPPAK